MGFDLFSAPRHVRDQVTGNAADFKQPLARIEIDLIAALAQQMGKLVPVNLPRYHLLGVHRPCFEAEEALRLRVIGDVHHHHMGVEMRIKFARGMLGKTREDEPSGRALGDLAVNSLASRGLLLNPGEHDTNGPFMGFYNSLIPGDERHDRHGLRGIHGEVPTGMVLDFATSASAPELLSPDLPLQQLREDGAVDLALEAEFLGNRSAPFAMFAVTLRIIVADRIVAGDVGGGAFEAAWMDHAGLAELRVP